MNEDMQEAEWYMLFAFFMIIWMIILMMMG